jgi:hypothetical protein
LRNIELLSDEIFDIGVHLIPEYKEILAHYHYDVRFLLRTTDNDDDIQISDESSDLQWFAEVSTFSPDISIDIPRMFNGGNMNIANTESEISVNPRSFRCE